MPRKPKTALVPVVAVPLTPVPDPWDRQPSDTDEAFEAFVAYRDALPPRRLIRPGVGSTQRQMDFYKFNNWKDRTHAWDRHLDAIRRAEFEAVHAQTAKEIAVRHKQLLHDVHELASREIEKLLVASRASDMAGLIRPAELIKLIDLNIKYDRLVRDQSTDNIAAVVQDLSKLSMDDLRALDEMHAKIAKPGSDE